jgi:hypothetical protein
MALCKCGRIFFRDGINNKVCNKCKNNNKEKWLKKRRDGMRRVRNVNKKLKEDGNRRKGYKKKKGEENRNTETFK